MNSRNDAGLGEIISPWGSTVLARGAKKEIEQRSEYFLREIGKLLLSFASIVELRNCKEIDQCLWRQWYVSTHSGIIFSFHSQSIDKRENWPSGKMLSVHDYTPTTTSCRRISISAASKNLSKENRHSRTFLYVKYVTNDRKHFSVTSYASIRDAFVCYLFLHFLYVQRIDRIKIMRKRAKER